MPEGFSKRLKTYSMSDKSQSVTWVQFGIILTIVASLLMTASAGMFGLLWGEIKENRGETSLLRSDIFKELRLLSTSVGEINGLLKGFNFKVEE